MKAFFFYTCVAALAVTGCSSGSDTDNGPGPASSGASSGGAGGGGDGGAGGGGDGGAGGGGNGGAGGGVAAPGVCDPTDPALILCYTWNAFPIVDESGKNPTADSGGVTLAEAGIEGTAGSFSGTTTQVVPFNDFWKLNEFTAEVWVKPTGVPKGCQPITTGSILLYLAPSNDDLGLNGDLKLEGNGWSGMGTAFVPLDAWTHIAFVRDGSIGTLYANGELAVSTSYDLPTEVSGMDILVGKDYTGLMDNLRVYNAPRTAKQICEDAGKSGC